MNEADLFQIPLEKLNLYEASAGTGKTWTLTGLYLRFILELGLTVDEILVVTYTKAATAELKDRIRRRLADALKALEVEKPEDVFFQKMLKNIDPNRDAAKQRLKLAICNFDEASIFTIHGFCQRVLTDRAFETGMEFESELSPDETPILREVVDDFWRCETCGPLNHWIEFLAQKKQTPDAWLKAIKPHLGKPYIHLAEIETIPEASEAIRQSYAKAQALWQAENIRDLMLELDLSQVSYKKEKLKGWLVELDLFFAQTGQSLPGALAKFTPEALKKGLKKNAILPEQPFFNACQTLLDAEQQNQKHLESRLIQTQLRLLQKCDQELPKRKSVKNLISYNDLLNRLAEALAQEPQLAINLRQRYPAALIDEFQDTDPVQYSIFKALYQDQKNPAFFVGDPKQAIYGFRGADIFSYLQAREKTVKRYTLATNQRSSPELIEACNALFSRSQNPFIFQEIPYVKVEAAEKTRAKLYCEEAEPFRFLLLPEKIDEKGKASALSKAEADRISAESSANEIARLLDPHAKVRIDDKPLSGGDIAILAPSHRQALAVQKSLNKRNIPSVRQGQDNVFATPEALELNRILSAIAEPRNDAKLLSSLATEIMGYSASELYKLKEGLYVQEKNWDSLMEETIRYHSIWQEKGFTPMFRRLLEDKQIAQRLLSLEGGERRLTNLLHLSECLQIAQSENPGIASLLNWFCQTIFDPDEDEQSLLRLESDAERVKIVTLHTSKGLEYPIVFCPFLWDGKLWHKNETEASYHDAALNPMLDLGGPDIALHRALAEREKFAEKMRLLYVALTRAKYRCYIHWGHVKDMQNAALSWLLHGPASELSENPLALMAEIFASIDHAEIVKQLNDFKQSAPDSIAIQAIDSGLSIYNPPKTSSQKLQALNWQRKNLHSSWRMTSFSALTQNKHSETPDYDAPVSPSASTREDDSIFSFPRGKTAGRCLHSIFESWDFKSNDRSELDKLIERKLKAHAIDSIWVPSVAKMIHATLNSELNESGLKLAEIGESLPELEFTYPLQNLNVRQLQKIIGDPKLGMAKPFAEALQKLNFDTVQGYMKGFIDLSFEANGRFYIIDYKSNWLGDRLSDYAPEKLTDAMAHAHYYLQYLIYTLALHRYLKLRIQNYDYETHFGGIFYLFLRGMEPGSDTGIFKDRPKLELIEKLDKAAS